MPQLSPQVQTPAPAELVIKRDEERIDYEVGALGTYGTQVSVVRWPCPTNPAASIYVAQGAFHLQMRLSAAELRRLALALNVAADEVDGEALQELPR